MKKDLARPKKINEHGWFVCEDVEEGCFADYLHTDGKMHTSTYSHDGYSGYFPTEVEAYKAIMDFYIKERKARDVLGARD